MSGLEIKKSTESYSRFVGPVGRPFLEILKYGFYLVYFIIRGAKFDGGKIYLGVVIALPNSALSSAVTIFGIRFIIDLARFKRRLRGISRLLPGTSLVRRKRCEFGRHTVLKLSRTETCCPKPVSVQSFGRMGSLGDV